MQKFNLIKHIKTVDQEIEVLMYRLLRSTLIFMILLTGALATETQAGVFDIPDVTIKSFQFRAFQDDTTGLVWLDIDNFWENGWSYELIESFLSGSGFHLANRADLDLLQASVPDFVYNFTAVSMIIGGNYLGNSKAKEDRGLIWGVYDDEIINALESHIWQYEGEAWGFQPTVVPRDIVFSEAPDGCGPSGCIVKFADLGAWVVQDSNLTGGISLLVANEKVWANGVEQAYFTVQLTDYDSNSLADHVLQITAAPPEDVLIDPVTAEVVTDDLGQAQFTATSTRLGSVTFTVTDLKDTTLKASVHIQFVTRRIPTDRSTAIPWIPLLLLDN